MNPRNINKYLYIENTPPWLLRTIYAAGIVAWLGVIYGYSKFIALSPIFFIIIAPIIGFIVFHHLISYGIVLLYRQFDLKTHQLFIKRHDNFVRENENDPAAFPSIDIFLTICGEDSSILRRTFLAVSHLRYPNKKVYVLDDRGVDEHATLSRSHGFIYLSRENKGEMKKAGNIKYGYDRSSGDFIVIFDADFAPHPDFIKELLPYMADPHVAIVQSPQYFQADDNVHDRSPLEYGAAHVQEDFYRIIQVARGRLGAPICCGSNALYRRSALESIGGTFQSEHSEDMYTGFELINKGWKILYIPIILAVGLCPDSLHSYFHQQHRWCSGSLGLMLDRKFWNSNLSISQKLCFISGFMYYLSHPVAILLSFQAFFILFFYQNDVSIWNALPFIPCIIFSFIVIPLFRCTRQRYGGFLAQTAYLYSYTHAAVFAFLRKSAGWEPTNSKNVDISNPYMQQVWFTAAYLLLYLSIVGLVIGKGLFKIFDMNYYAVLFWIFYNSIATTIILVQLYLVLDRTKQEQIYNGRTGALSLSLWRLKTAGAYIAVLVLLFFVAVWY